MTRSHCVLLSCVKWRTAGMHIHLPASNRCNKNTSMPCRVNSCALAMQAFRYPVTVRRWPAGRHSPPLARMICRWLRCLKVIRMRWPSCTKPRRTHWPTPRKLPGAPGVRSHPMHAWPCWPSMGAIFCAAARPGARGRMASRMRWSVAPAWRARHRRRLERGGHACHRQRRRLVR
jgi:hypothetical protein